VCRFCATIPVHRCHRCHHCHSAEIDSAQLTEKAYLARVFGLQVRSRSIPKGPSPRISLARCAALTAGPRIAALVRRTSRRLVSIHHSHTTIRRITLALHAQNAQPVHCMSLKLRSESNSNPCHSPKFCPAAKSTACTFPSASKFAMTVLHVPLLPTVVWTSGPVAFVPVGTLRSWVAHYNKGRPHSSLGPGTPEPTPFAAAPETSTASRLSDHS
jgi:hypothetical protein